MVMDSAISGDRYENQVLPEYSLDSNLVLLPGIIYNVTITRFKAALLFSRFRDFLKDISLVRALIEEYQFEEPKGKKKQNGTTMYKISEDAIKGIKHFVSCESKYTDTRGNSHEINGLDWFILAISPNVNRIKNSEDTLFDDYKNIATICRIVGIMDDNNEIKITLQALVRGVKSNEYTPRSPNEGSYEIVWNSKIENVERQFSKIDSGARALFGDIDKFTKEYKAVLISLSNKSGGDYDKVHDLLTLNPLANAFYSYLSANKDFTKAHDSLVKLYAKFRGSSKIDTDTLLRIIDLTTAILPFPNHIKLRVLATVNPTSRVDQMVSITSYMHTVFESLWNNNEFINHWFYKEATDMQKANMIANQLKAIRLVLDEISNTRGQKNNNNSNKKRTQVLRRPNNSIQAHDEHDDDDDDDMKPIADFFRNKLSRISSLSEDTKRLLVKDYKRVKKSPSSNSDYYVIRNYLDIVIDIPWDVFVTKFKNNKDIDIDFAEKQLDNDHYGLKHVKKRLIQYLVVLKLLDRNAAEALRNHEDPKSGTSNDYQKEKTNADFYKDSTKPIAITDDKSENNPLKKTGNTDLSNNKSLMVYKVNKSPIILLAGPPGTGKTSLAKSIAKSLGRRFQRISLGGIREEAEIRGHRRTYVGAMPGVIIQALRKAGSMNPVILLDEIDKVVGGHSSVNKFNGDPSAALLEVLDPEQNNTFTDHYLGFPVDLSQVIFICTANEPHSMTAPLLDRLEMIEVGAYDYEEKLVIGKRYLLPRQVKRNGIDNCELIKVDDTVMKSIILDYTREAGVRNFERKLGTLCRFKAVEYSESLENKQKYNPTIEMNDLPKYLGAPHPNMTANVFEQPADAPRFGVVNGLSYNTDGSGSALIFECIGFPNGSKNQTGLNMTGRLGEVLMESAKIGLTFVRHIIYKNQLNIMSLGINENLVEKMNGTDIHLHVPEGAISKDGPSAGITMALSFLSLILEKSVPSNIAMTGEITLRGLVLPIGGIKEKLLGAYLSGVKRVIVPRENRRDLIEEYCKACEKDDSMSSILKDNLNIYHYKNSEPEDYYFKKYGIQIKYAKEFSDVLRIVWGDNIVQKFEHSKQFEYRL